MYQPARYSWIPRASSTSGDLGRRPHCLPCRIRAVGQGLPWGRCRCLAFRRRMESALLLRSRCRRLEAPRFGQNRGASLAASARPASRMVLRFTIPSDQMHGRMTNQGGTWRIRMVCRARKAGDSGDGEERALSQFARGAAVRRANRQPQPWPARRANPGMPRMIESSCGSRTPSAPVCAAASGCGHPDRASLRPPELDFGAAMFRAPSNHHVSMFARVALPFTPTPSERT